MELDKIEKCITSAEILYGPLDQKLNYVNVKLGFVRQARDGNKVKTETIPGCESQLIKHWRYYEILRRMDSKTIERAQTISKKRFTGLINEHSFLKNIRPEINKLAIKAEDDQKWSQAKKIWDLQIQIGQRIAALADIIYYTTVDPGHITYRLEQSEEQEENLNEQIRLFTELT